MIIGVDYHPSFQQIAFFDQETGECGKRQLNHSDGEAEQFYRDLKLRGVSVRVGMEATGYSRWFARLLAEPGIEVWIGDAAKIKTKRVRKQQTDRQDVQLLLKLLLENVFPRVWVPSPENRDLRQLLWHRNLAGADVDADHESAASGGDERRQALEERTAQRTRTSIARKLPLAAWASRRRQDLLELLDRMNPTIEELTAPVEPEARKWPKVLRLSSPKFLLFERPRAAGVKPGGTESSDSKTKMVWICKHPPS